MPSLLFRHAEEEERQGREEEKGGQNEEGGHLLKPEHERALYPVPVGRPLFLICRGEFELMPLLSCRITTRRDSLLAWKSRRDSLRDECSALKQETGAAVNRRLGRVKQLGDGTGGREELLERIGGLEEKIKVALAERKAFVLSEEKDVAGNRHHVILERQGLLGLGSNLIILSKIEIQAKHDEIVEKVDALKAEIQAIENFDFHKAMMNVNLLRQRRQDIEDEHRHNVSEVKRRFKQSRHRFEVDLETRVEEARRKSELEALAMLPQREQVGSISSFLVAILFALAFCVKMMSRVLRAALLFLSYKRRKSQIMNG